MWVNVMSNQELQHKIDVEKWLESETNHFDMCGSYDYCVWCNKDEATPCANAFERMNQKREEEKPNSKDSPPKQSKKKTTDFLSAKPSTSKR